MGKGKDWKRLGEYVQRRRIALDWGRDELAARAHMSLRTVASIERGQNPTMRDATQYAIEHVLGWGPGSVDEILAGREPVIVSEPENTGPDLGDDLGYVLWWLPRLSEDAATAARRALEPYVNAHRTDGHNRRSSDRPSPPSGVRRSHVG